MGRNLKELHLDKNLVRVLYSQCFEESEALLRDAVDASFWFFDVAVLQQPSDDGLGLSRRRGFLEDGLRQRRIGKIK